MLILILFHFSQDIHNNDIVDIIYYNVLTGASIGFVDLFFNLSSNSATCLFPKSLEGTRKLCSIEYGVSFREVCQMFAEQNSTSVSDRVTVLFPVSDLQSEYCFTATLSSGTFTAVIEGTINGTTSNSFKNFTILNYG